MLHAPLDTGYGLVGIRERVDALGGTFRPGPTSRCGGPRRGPGDRPRAVNVSQSGADHGAARRQAMVRAGFRMVVDGQPGMTVIGGADDGRAPVELASRIRPDVCLLTSGCSCSTGWPRPDSSPAPTCSTRCEWSSQRH